MILKTKHVVVAAAVLAACVGSTTSALAEDAGQITLFGQAYDVQRFDYAEMIKWADPLAAGVDLSLISVEGAHFLGNDRILLSTDAGDSLLSYKNWVIEAEMTRDSAGKINGLRYVRTVLINDPITPSLGGFDLSPCGVTINTSTSGLGANGNLVIGDSEANGVWGYSITTGAQGSFFTGGTDNDSFDDLVYVPTNNLLYTINEDGFALVSFTTSGTVAASTPIPGLKAINSAWTPGSPKGMVFLPDAPTVPAAIRATGGTILVTLDDNNPGLQVYNLAGGVIATEPLTTNPGGFGTPLLDRGPTCTSPLQFEATAFNAADGTIFLINESEFFDCANFYILTPVAAGCPADFNGDGFLDFTDFDDFVGAFEAGEARGDFNDDGFLDFTDFDAFVGAFEAGC
jgi:hypothetical protein